MIIQGTDIRVQGRFVHCARLAGEGYDYTDSPEGIVEALRRCNRRIDLFTFTQRLSDLEPKYPFHMEWDNMAVLPISTVEQWWGKQIDAKVRNMARLAGKKGVVVKEVQFDEALVRGISGIYNETPIRQGKRFWHYGKDLEHARRVNATFLDRSTFIGAYFEEELIGFVKMTTDETGGQAGLMQILSMVKHRDKAPTNALIAQAVQSCADREIPFLFYAQFSYGNKEWDGLAEFKYKNGFRKVEIPRFYVPVNGMGSVVLRFGLHRPIEDYIPSVVMERYRHIRNLWYRNKISTPQPTS